MSPAQPFRTAQVGSLRLLVGYLLIADEAAPARAALRSFVPEFGRGSACSLFHLIALSRSSAPVAWTIDGMLGALVAAEGKDLADLTIAGIAELWWREGIEFEGARLTALLWHLARTNDTATAPLEQAIVRSSDVWRCLSREQRMREGLDMQRSPARAAL